MGVQNLHEVDAGDDMKNKVATTFAGKNAQHLSTASLEDFLSLLKSTVPDEQQREDIALFLKHGISQQHQPHSAPWL